MQTVIHMADRWHISPMEILKSDVDDVFLAISALIEAQNRADEQNDSSEKEEETEERKKVTFSTSTGGWF